MSFQLSVNCFNTRCHSENCIDRNDVGTNLDKIVSSTKWNKEKIFRILVNRQHSVIPEVDSVILNQTLYFIADVYCSSNFGSISFISPTVHGFQNIWQLMECKKWHLQDFIKSNKFLLSRCIIVFGFLLVKQISHQNL